MVAPGSSVLQAREQQLLSGLLERGERVVENDDARLVDQQAGDGKALALAVGEHLVPARHLVEPRAERAQAHLLQRGRQPVVGADARDRAQDRAARP